MSLLKSHMHFISIEHIVKSFNLESAVRISRRIPLYSSFLKTRTCLSRRWHATLRSSLKIELSKSESKAARNSATDSSLRASRSSLRARASVRVSPYSLTLRVLGEKARVFFLGVLGRVAQSQARCLRSTTGTRFRVSTHGVSFVVSRERATVTRASTFFELKDTSLSPRLVYDTLSLSLSLSKFNTEFLKSRPVRSTLRVADGGFRLEKTYPPRTGIDRGTFFVFETLREWLRDWCRAE